ELVHRIPRVAVSSADPATMPPLLLALICEQGIAGTDPGPLFAAALERSYAASDHDALRRIAAVASTRELDIAPALAQCYASLCQWVFASPVPLPWPRRTAGMRLRVVTLVDDGASASARTL